MTQNSSAKIAEPQEIRHFDAEVGKVLKLMIHSLYTNKDIFLRELVSNASDACDRLRHAALTNAGLIQDGETLSISVSVNKDARTLTIADNGIGMSREELIQNLGTIARSGTQEFMSRVNSEGKNAASLIGQFGVGFYSAFMVADRVVVVSQKAGEAGAYRWESNGEGEYAIGPAERAPSHGTSITLHLRAGEDSYLDNFRLRHIIQTYSDHIGFPIELEGEAVNKASALWMRPKADITPEQYQEFYRHVAHAPDEPWLTLHHKAEGALEYTALLFIPSLPPFDLYHPDRKRRVKLYVKRVFIAEDGIELIPHYLRFLRGVVDSEDLPLNISRETLQASPVLAKIREAVAKRMLSELKKRSDKAEDYAIFWKHFGPVLKEGLCESATPREQILEVCRFSSTGSDGLVGLDDYIARMKPEQKDIFYLTGEQLDTLRGHPQLEGFAKRGIEVLLLTDHVDDFWLSVVQDYKGKPFKSITRADIDLSALGDSAEEKPAAPTAQTSELLTRFKAALGDAVRDVRATTKLSDSASCLAIEEGAMDIRLERFLREQKQLPSTSAKILEVNIDHPILLALAARLNDVSAEADIADVAWLLLDQARVVEGETVSDPAAFLRRLNRFVEKGLAQASA